MHTTKISKFLSLVLRHDPGRIRLTLDQEGWAEVDELLERLATAGKPVSRVQLDHVVETNAKQRFRFSEDGTRIRASQGHSIKIELGLEAIPPPDTLFNGTATRFLESIREKGLVRGSRRHVHMSADLETAIAVGRRHGKPGVLTVRAGEMQAAGHVFFLSDNGVWLTERVPPEFLDESEA